MTAASANRKTMTTFHMIRNHHQSPDEGTWTLKVQYITNGKKNLVDIPLETLQKEEPVACAKYIIEWIAEEGYRRGKGPLSKWANQVLNESKVAALPTRKTKKKKRNTREPLVPVPSHRINAKKTSTAKKAPKTRAKGRRLGDGRMKRKIETFPVEDGHINNEATTQETPLPDGVEIRPGLGLGLGPLKKLCQADCSSVSGSDESNAETDGDGSYSY